MLRQSTPVNIQKWFCQHVFVLQWRPCSVFMVHITPYWSKWKCLPEKNASQTLLAGTQLNLIYIQYHAKTSCSKLMAAFIERLWGNFKNYYSHTCRPSAYTLVEPPTSVNFHLTKLIWFLFCHSEKMLLLAVWLKTLRAFL